MEKSQSDATQANERARNVVDVASGEQGCHCTCLDQLFDQIVCIFYNIIILKMAPVCHL